MEADCIAEAISMAGFDMIEMTNDKTLIATLDLDG